MPIRWLLCFFSVIALVAPNSGLPATYEYDDLGRLMLIIYDDGTSTTYLYDPAGNRSLHKTERVVDAPVNDGIPTLGVGNSLIDVTNWPTGGAPAPAGPAAVAGWPISATYYNETRWIRKTGPGESGIVIAMNTGQVEADANGGGVNSTNSFVIDPEAAYEFSIYFKKYDHDWQNIYFGTKTGGTVEMAWNGVLQTNPYFLAWSRNTQAAYLDEDKWYKVVAYVLPEGHPLVSNSNWGGIYEVESGIRVASIKNYRWSEHRPNDTLYARFFTYYSQEQQSQFTNHFYLPEVRKTNVTYSPVVPSLSITHTNGSEGGTVTFSVALSEPTTVDVDVDYLVTHDGSTNSASSTDYTSVSGTLTILEGSTGGGVTVSTTEDANYEGDEHIWLELTDPVRATLAESSEQALILDDDVQPPVFFIANDSVSEGGTLSFSVSKQGDVSATYSVSYATANGSANTADYTPKSGTLTFSPGQTSKSVTVQTREDSTHENNETLRVNLSSASSGSSIGDSQATGTITNDDAGPRFSINNKSVSEGGNLVFTVSKTGVTAKSHSVNYSTVAGTAEASDFTAASGTLTFTASQTSKTVAVGTTEDSTTDGNETIKVNLSSATNGASISDSQGNGTIIDDESPPVAQDDSVTVPRGINWIKFFNVTANDNDPDGDDLTVISVTSPWNANLSIGGGGSGVWVHGRTVGTGLGSYTVSDGHGGADTATIWVTVNEDYDD